MATIVDKSEAFPIHCEMSMREFAAYRDAKNIADPLERVREMRYHLEQALLQFKSAQEVLVETANRTMGAEILQEGFKRRN